MILTITMKNLRLRNGIYEFRLAIPADCRKALDGQTEITKSLKTKDDDEAALLARQEAKYWKDTFKEIRQSAKAPTSSPLNTPPDVVAEFRKKLTAHMKQHLPALLGKQSEKELKASADFYLNCLFLVRNNEKCDLTEELGISVPLPKQASPGITRKLNRIVIDLINELRAAVDEELGFEYSKELEADILEPIPPATTLTTKNKHTPQTTAPAQQSSPVLPQSQPQESSPAIAEVLKECIAAKKRSLQVQDDIAKEIGVLLDWLKLDADSTPITSITTNNIIDYRDNCLKLLPKNANRMADTKDMTLREQTAYGKKHEDKLISITTINNRLTSLGILFNYASKRHYVPYAVTEALLLDNPQRQEKLSGASFSGYSDDQMSKLIKHQQKYILKYTRGREWRYWIPLILAYTGCRANEIAMLTVHDIKEDEDGIMYFDLRNDEKLRQRVKNAMSVRTVPICQKILDLGFLDYVGRVSSRNNREERLWPGLAYCPKNGWVRNVSYHFNKTIRPAIDAQDVSSGLHGLRSSFSRALQRKKVDQRIIDELTGHMPAGISQIALGYQGRLELKELKAAVDKLDWEKCE